MTLSLIAAMDRNRGIGYQNDLPWRGKVPADMKRFRELTLGHTVIMGRKTYESIGKALPERNNLVLSHSDYDLPDALVCPSLDEALRAGPFLSKSPHQFIIGGASVFMEGMNIADRIYLTIIDHKFPADTFFPDYHSNDWAIIKEVEIPRDEKNQFPMYFLTLEKKTA